MTKKAFSLFMALIMALSVFGFSFNTLADDTSDDADNTRYSVISMNTGALRISGITAKCNASLTASYSTTVSIKMELQKKKSGAYETVKTWSDSRTGTTISLSGSRTINVLSTYRLKVTFTAGNETIVRYYTP